MIFFIRKNLARHVGKACLAAWVVCVQACAGDSAPKVEQPEAITAGQTAPPLVGMGEALLILNQAENTQKELQALSEQLDAVPAQTRDAHPDEYAEALANMEGMLEKQEQVISEAISAAQNAGPTVAGDVAGEAAAKASVRLNEEQSEAFRQCAQHTTEYRQLMQEIRDKMAKW